MAESVAVTYGGPLFELACETSLQGQILEDLETLDAVFSENPDFFRLLCAPVVPVGERIALVRDTLSGKFEEYTLNFLSLLIEKLRIGEFGAIAKEYRRLHHEYYGIQEVTVRSALPIAQPLQEKLEAALERLTRKKVIVRYVSDPSLLGGVLIETEGSVLDGSIRERLDALGRQLSATLG